MGTKTIVIPKPAPPRPDPLPEPIPTPRPTPAEPINPCIDAVVNISYAGTNLKFCNDSPASTGNGFDAPTSVTLDEFGTAAFNIDLGLVYGMLVTTADGYGTITTEVYGCDNWPDYPPIDPWSPNPYDPGAWNDWPPYNPDSEISFNFKWCSCDVIGSVPNSGGDMPYPVKTGLPRCSYHFPTEDKCKGFFKAHPARYPGDC